MYRMRAIASWIITSVLAFGSAAGVVILDRGPQTPPVSVASETTVPPTTIAHHAGAAHGTATRFVPLATTPQVPVGRVTTKVRTGTDDNNTTSIESTTSTGPTTTVPPSTSTTAAPPITVAPVTTTTVRTRGGDGGGTSTTIDN